MPPSVKILDNDRFGIRRSNVIRTDRRLAVAAGNIEHIGRLAQAGQTSAKAAHQLLSGRDIGAQMRGAGREIAVMQVVRLDPAFDQRAHQIAHDLRRIVDALQQHRLRKQRNAGIGQARAGRARAAAQFARMIDVHGDICRLALDLQRPHQLRRDARRIGDRNACMNAHDLDVIDLRKRLHHRAQPPRRQHQWIAAGEDHFPDLRMAPDVVERGVSAFGDSAFGLSGQSFRGGSKTGNRPRRHA